MSVNLSISVKFLQTIKETLHLEIQYISFLCLTELQNKYCIQIQSKLKCVWS